MRFSKPNKIVSNSPETDEYSSLLSDHVWNFNPLIRKPSEQKLSQEYNMDNYYYSLTVPSVSSNEKTLELSSKVQKSNNKKPLLNYPGYGISLYPRPHQLVHNSLPDCNSVGSSVLCKPPLHFRESLEDYGNSENNPLLYNTHQTQIVKNIPQVSAENSPHSESAIELTGEAYNIYPPHVVPKSYPLRSDIYKNFFSDLTGFGQSKSGDKNCQKSTFIERTTSDDYITPLESHKFSNSAVTNDLSQYDLNTHTLSLSQKSEQKIPKYSEGQNEFYSRLIRIIQSDESLNKLKNLLLQSENSSPKATSKFESPKLSLLGVLILPSSVIKELDYGQHEQTQSAPDEFENKNLSENSFESDVPEMTMDLNETLPTVIYNDNDDYKKNDSLKENQQPANETKRFSLPSSLQLILSKGNIAQNTGYNSSYSDFPAETVISPKLYVHDEQSLSETQEKNNLNFTADNWRKILEDEISKEIRESSLRLDVPSMDTSVDESNNSEHSQEGQYNNFNKHIGPLYDSTGKLIQPENVPIHIHRFNPPSDLTSLPWKYSIPRPAPPRSIVVPPKPPTLA